jgi:hypothetical protein
LLYRALFGEQLAPSTFSSLTSSLSASQLRQTLRCLVVLLNCSAQSASEALAAGHKAASLRQFRKAGLPSLAQDAPEAPAPSLLVDSLLDGRVASAAHTQSAASEPSLAALAALAASCATSCAASAAYTTSTTSAAPQPAAGAGAAAQASSSAPEPAPARTRPSERLRSQPVRG